MLTTLLLSAALVAPFQDAPAAPDPAPTPATSEAEQALAEHKEHLEHVLRLAQEEARKAEQAAQESVQVRTDVQEARAVMSEAIEAEDADRNRSAVLPSGALPAPVAEMVPEPPTAARQLPEVVPAGTTSLWHRRSTAKTALLDSYTFEVVDAVLEARFDEFALDALQQFGADQELVDFIASWRNTFGSLGAVVPWRELVQREFVWSTTMTPAFNEDMGLPSMLLACRPEPSRLADIETSLAGLFGGSAAFLGSNIQYDIRRETNLDGSSTKVYRLHSPAFGGATLVQMAIHDETILIGAGKEYFADALNLMRGTGVAERLTDQPRYQAAFDDLRMDATEYEYLDVPLFKQNAEDMTALLAKHEFHAGTFQSMVNDAFHLVDHVESIASATVCDGADVITETVTRFNRETARANPMHGAGMASAASSEMLFYVPGDAVSFEMRGTVNLVPIYHYGQDSLKRSTDWAEDALWAWGILEAAVDLSIERDLLSWLGTQHVSVTMPARQKYAEDGATDSVMICMLKDPVGARRALARAEAIFEAAAPRMLGGIQELSANMGLPQRPDVRLAQAEGSFPMLKRLEIDLPMQLPPAMQPPRLTYGVLGNLLVFSTSEDAIMSCMQVAAGEEDGLEVHALAEALLGREDLTSARLDPHGQRMTEATQGVQMMGMMLNSFLSGFTNENPTMQTVLDCSNDLVGRVTSVMQTVDFLGDGVTHSERRDGGLARYERSVVRLKAPEARPSYDAQVAANSDIR